MKRIFLCIGALLFLASCAPGLKYLYSYRLQSPDSDDMRWDDGNTLWEFSVGETSISLQLTNNSDETINIIWDEASFVQNDRAQKVMHSGIKYGDRNQSQPPTVIPPHTKINDIIIPVDNIYWTSGMAIENGYVPGRWHELPIFPNYDKNKVELKNEILSYKGKIFKVYLPVERSGEKEEYVFNFVVTEIEEISPNY